MPVTVYKSSDAGAPSFSSQTRGAVGVILKACLVDGYASKAAAGWTADYVGSVGTSDEHRVVLKNANTPNPLYVDIEHMNSSNTGSEVFIHDNQVSPGVYTTNMEHTQNWVGFNNPVVNDWMVVANNKTFYLITRRATTQSPCLHGAGNFVTPHATIDKPFFAFGSDSVNGSFTATQIQGDLGNAAKYILTMQDIAGNRPNQKAAMANGTMAQYATAIPIVRPSLDTAVIRPMRMIYHNSNQGENTDLFMGHFPGLWALKGRMLGEGHEFNGPAGTALAGKSFVCVHAQSASAQGYPYILETSDTWMA